MTKHINNLNQTSPKRELEQSLLKCIKTSLVVLEDTIWSSWPWFLRKGLGLGSNPRRRPF